MNLQLASRYRCLVVVSLLMLFGVPEYAQGGLLARLRARRCRGVICPPSCCQPSCCEPSCCETAAAEHAALKGCPGRLCQFLVVATYYDSGNPPQCLYKTFLCKDCDKNVSVQHDANCDWKVSRYCNLGPCNECIPKPPTALISAIFSAATGDGNGDAAPEDQYDRYVEEALWDNGMPENPTVVPGDEYTVEEREVNGTKKTGMSFNMTLLDEKQQPMDRTVLVHLDWFMPKDPKDKDPREKVGTGYVTVNEPDERPEYHHKRYSPCVYAVYVKHGSKWRFYVVFLPKTAVKE